MEELVKWLKENVGTNITIVTPQFERTHKLAFDWTPASDNDFYAIVTKAPWDILKGLGFGKWDTMNNLIKDNVDRPQSEKIGIPIINAPGEEYVVDIGRGNAPTQLLDVDEDVMLFPGEWFSLIPEGFIVTGLYGESYPFEKTKADDDIRYGCLAYGIRREWR